MNNDKILIPIILCINLYTNQLELSGTVVSDNEKMITSRNMGYVKSVNVDEGSSVKKGQVLYEIDSSNMDSNKKRGWTILKFYKIKQKILN